MCDDRVNQYIGSDGRFICDVPTLARIIDTECDSQQDCRQDCCGDVLRRYMYGDNNNRISGCHYNSAFRDGLQQLAQNSGPDGAQAARRIEDLYNLCKRIEQPVDPIVRNPMGTGWPPGYGYPSNLSEVTTPLCEGSLHQIQNSNKAGGMKAWSEGQTQTVTCNPGFQGGGVYRCVAQRGRDGSIQFGSFEGPDGTGEAGRPCERIVTCPPTQVANSDKSATGSIPTGNLGDTVPVTCTSGAFGGGSWTCTDDDGVKGGSATFKGNPCTVGDPTTDCHDPPCVAKMRTQADDEYNFNCNHDVIWCGERSDAQYGSHVCSTNRRSVSVDMGRGGPDLERCPTGYGHRGYSRQCPSINRGGQDIDLPCPTQGIIRECQRLDGWSCSQPCGPDHIYNDKCAGQPLHQDPGSVDPIDGG